MSRSMNIISLESPQSRFVHRAKHALILKRRGDFVEE